MEKAIHERLKAIRTALKLSQRDFAKGVYTSQSFYARLEQGKITVNDRLIELICSKYKVNKRYLKEGEGAMFSQPPPDIRLEQLSDIFNELNGLFQEYLIVQAKELLKFQKKTQEAEDR